MLSNGELETRDLIEELEDVLELLKIKMDKRKDNGKKPKKKHSKRASLAESLLEQHSDTPMLYTGTLKELEKADRIDDVEAMFESKDISYRDQKGVLEMLFGEE